MSHYDDDDEKMTAADLAQRGSTQLCQRWAAEGLPTYVPVVLVDELRLEAMRSVGVRHATLFTHAANKIQELERQLAEAARWYDEENPSATLLGEDVVRPWDHAS